MVKRGNKMGKMGIPWDVVKSLLKHRKGNLIFLTYDLKGLMVMKDE
jgi:hypothetical protein